MALAETPRKHPSRGGLHKPGHAPSLPWRKFQLKMSWGEKIKHWGTSRNTHQCSHAKGWRGSLFPSLRNISHECLLLKMREGSSSVNYPESRTFSNSQHNFWKVYFLEEHASKKHLNSTGCFLLFETDPTLPNATMISVVRTRATWLTKAS